MTLGHVDMTLHTSIAVGILDPITRSKVCMYVGHQGEWGGEGFAKLIVAPLGGLRWMVL